MWSFVTPVSTGVGFLRLSIRGTRYSESVLEVHLYPLYLVYLSVKVALRRNNALFGIMFTVFKILIFVRGPKRKNHTDVDTPKEKHLCPKVVFWSSIPPDVLVDF